jgi:hypothetical protein
LRKPGPWHLAKVAVAAVIAAVAAAAVAGNKSTQTGGQST